MFSQHDKKSARQRRHRGIRRSGVVGSMERPRLVVSKSCLHWGAQVIDDSRGRTLVAASTHESDVRAGLESTSNVAAATRVGKLLGERARIAGVTEVVFDRAGHRYHPNGGVASLADEVRSAGVRF